MFVYVNQFRIKYVAFWHMYYILHISRDVIYIALPSHLELRTLTTFFHSPFSQDCETKNIFFDCSTSTSRENPECAMDVTTCVRPTHAIYSVLLNRYITPIEMLSVQGIWRCDSENLSAWNSMVANGRLAQSLAGNGFSATVAQAAFLTSLVECDAWRDVIHREDPSEPQGSLVTREQSVEQPVEQSVEQSSAPHPHHLAVKRRLRKKTTLVPVSKKNRRGVGAGNKNSKGKKPMATIWQKEFIMVEYEKAKAEGKKKPIKSVEDLPGYHPGCVYPSKWGGQRVAQQWTLLCKTAPALMKKHKEIPNCLRRLLDIKKMKHAVSSLNAIDQIHMPVPLQTVVEDMLMDRILLGEEINMQYAKHVLIFCTELWNSVVSSMSEAIGPACLEMIKRDDARLAELPEDQLQIKVNELTERAARLLKPIKISPNDSTLLTFVDNGTGCSKCGNNGT